MNTGSFRVSIHPVKEKRLSARRRTMHSSWFVRCSGISQKSVRSLSSPVIKLFGSSAPASHARLLTYTTRCQLIRASLVNLDHHACFQALRLGRWRLCEDHTAHVWLRGVRLVGPQPTHGEQTCDTSESTLISPSCLMSAPCLPLIGTACSCVPG